MAAQLRAAGWVCISPEDLDETSENMTADHPYTDPGDGRVECNVCGKWIYPITHSCKGVPVTPAARRRMNKP